jgi:ribosome biogenesis GTPase
VIQFDPFDPYDRALLPVALARLGADPARVREVAELLPSLPPDARPGRVARVGGGRAYVLTAAAGAAPAAGEPAAVQVAAGRHTVVGDTDSPLAVGDWVAVAVANADADCGDGDGDGGGGEPAVVHRLARRGSLTRRAAGRRSDAQVLAAGVDVALITLALPGPPRLGRLERLLALAWDGGVLPVVVLTKADLSAADARRDAVAAASAGAPGALVIALSARTGEGVAELRSLLGPGRTAVLLGSSGSGKSTLLNTLAGRQLARTEEVRAVDGKGRHTTTARELVVLPGGGVVIDTPGLRAIGMHGTGGEGLRRTFSDVTELAAGCRFADCAHRGEPGCAVVAAVEAGELDPRRLERHHRLRREVEYEARRLDGRARAEAKRHARTMSRAQRAMRERPGR